MTMRSEQHSMPISAFVPNRWNDNQMSARMFDKERRSIRDFGFIDPITARLIRAEEGDENAIEVDGLDGLWRLEIIDGEHRWRAAILEFERGDARLAELSTTVLIGCDDRVAKKLTIILNRMRGTAQQEKTAAILADLANTGGVDDLVAHLPFEEPEIRVMLDLAAGAWDPTAEPVSRPSDGDDWHALKLRVPKDAVGVIERALDAIEVPGKPPKEVRRGLALERLAADYIAGLPVEAEKARKR